ncbi:hypothetical protein, partial [Piscinibacter sp.]|uniref:hypothetical protein n=1 Tax=Piscinibacter sp. TaxID=1903157 RepID=UPI002B9C6B5A
RQMRRHIESLRASANEPLAITHVRQFRGDWVVVYRIGSDARQAFAVDARSGAVRSACVDEFI